MTSLVDGKTTHVITGVSLHTSVEDKGKKKLQELWQEVHYLIIDEFSLSFLLSNPQS